MLKLSLTAQTHRKWLLGSFKGEARGGEGGTKVSDWGDEVQGPECGGGLSGAACGPGSLTPCVTSYSLSAPSSDIPCALKFLRPQRKGHLGDGGFAFCVLQPPFAHSCLSGFLRTLCCRQMSWLPQAGLGYLFHKGSPRTPCPPASLSPTPALQIWSRPDPPLSLLRPC